MSCPQPTERPFDELPLPHNFEAERAILGGILMDAAAISAALQQKIEPTDFFDDHHQKIFSAMLEMRSANLGIELITLTDFLERKRQLSEVGAANLAQLIDGRPRISSVGHYARIVKEKALLRGLIYASDTIKKQAAEGVEDAEEVIRRAKESIRVLEHDRPAESLFHSFEEVEQTPPIRMAIEQIIQLDAATAIGALAGHGKTWLQLSIGKALLRGPETKLWGRFRVLESVPRVLYLIPESSLSPFAHRLRTLRMLDFVKEGRLLVRTLSKGPRPKLTDQRLLDAARDSFVMLDTLVRFSDGSNEDSAGEFQALADAILALLGAGALGVKAAHHSPKSFSGASCMSLEGILRGTGDIGAVFATVFGVKQLDAERNILHIENVKSRDFEPPQPFQLIGRPYLDQMGDFEMHKAPGTCGTLAEEQLQRDRGGAPVQVREAKAANKDLVRQFLTAEPSLSSSQLQAKLSDAGVTIDGSTIRRYRKELRL